MNSRSLVDGTLFLKYPSVIHEIMPDVFSRLLVKGNHFPSGVKPKSELINMGTPDIRLVNGSKTPDYAIYEQNEDDKETLEVQIHPTIVFDVGYSQPVQDLRHAAVRLIGSTQGAVRLVVAVKLSYQKVAGQDREVIEQVTAEYWEPEEVEKITGWKGPLNSIAEISRHPGNKTASNDPHRNPTKYEYVIRESASDFTRVVIDCTQTHEVCRIFSTLSLDD
jgi:hypothetical protein